MFRDGRDPARVRHPVAALVQRVCVVALGYADLNDHEQRHHDPLLALLAELAELAERDDLTFVDGTVGPGDYSRDNSRGSRWLRRAGEHEHGYGDRGGAVAARRPTPTPSVGEVNEA